MQAATQWHQCCSKKINQLLVHPKHLPKAQMNYSQIENEAFAILTACKKFQKHIRGNKNVQIESDHKPPEAIFKKPFLDAPARLQRILFEVLPYNRTMTYVKGLQLYIVEALSRVSHNTPEVDVTPTFEIHVLTPLSKESTMELQQAIDSKAPKHWVPAKIVQPVPKSGSYIIDTPTGRYRRNSWFVRPRDASLPAISTQVNGKRPVYLGEKTYDVVEQAPYTAAGPSQQLAPTRSCSRSTSPDFLGFGGDLQKRDNPNVDTSALSAPKKTRSRRNVIPPLKVDL
ncbi:hypothetical protein PR048_005573 [Dryococelus australis]|uniref:Reverse transcriptase RNase H-like domain-containing protein n=1 Tax=Dryococelus australis TaxID=614101 RepID=A0ABQ9I8J4_9NEOP|nr:hypothetical protein PR048_005573 [Dryococelus australis]